MRGRDVIAVALRHPDGRIVWADEKLAVGFRATRWARLPFVRGLVVLYETLVVGTRWLVRSAGVAAVGGLRSGSRRARAPEPVVAGARRPAPDTRGGLATAAHAARRAEAVLAHRQPASAAVAADARTARRAGGAPATRRRRGRQRRPREGRHRAHARPDPGVRRRAVLLPAAPARQGDRRRPERRRGARRRGRHPGDDLPRLPARSIGRTSDVRRTFQYHGAEHMSIHALEAGDPLTVERGPEVPHRPPALRHRVPGRGHPRLDRRVQPGRPPGDPGHDREPDRADPRHRRDQLRAAPVRRAPPGQPASSAGSSSRGSGSRRSPRSSRPTTCSRSRSSASSRPSSPTARRSRRRRPDRAQPAGPVAEARPATGA